MTSTPLVEENNISQELEVPDIQDMKTIRIHFNSALNSTRKGLPISANYALVHVSKSISLHQCGFRIINHRLHNIDSTVLCRGGTYKEGIRFQKWREENNCGTLRDDSNQIPHSYHTHCRLQLQRSNQCLLRVWGQKER